MKRIDEIIPELVKTGFVIYCGAGISIPAPSCAPSWWTLTEEILEAFFKKAPEEWGVPKDLIIKDENKQPEVIFETFANILEGKFYQIFDSLNVTEPNGNHSLIAKLAKTGLLKACITTNFDIFIERSLKQEGVKFNLLVDNVEYEKYNKNPDKNSFLLCKIHGTIERPDTIVSVASAYKSNKGFSSPKAEIISNLLVEYPFLFLGYSGYDFMHLNYKRYWERMGPKLHSIYWNIRPNEKTNVPFREIFDTSWTKFVFIEGELPKDAIESFSSIKGTHLEISSFNIFSIDKSIEYFNKAKTKRLDFFKAWSLQLPLPHTLGLVMSQSFMFSAQFKDFMQSLKDSQADKEAISYADSTDMSTQLTELGKKFGEGTISQAEYTKEPNRSMLRNSMNQIRKSWQEKILDYVEQNKYPGITDDMTVRSMWLAYIMQLGQNFNFDDSIENATNIAKDYKRLMTSYDMNSQADMLITGFKSSIMHPKEEFYKPYLEKMLVQKQKFLQNEFDYTTFATNLSKIIQEQSKAKMGMTVPLEPLSKKLIENISQIRSDNEFVEGLEVLLLTMDLVGSWLLGDLLQKKSFQEHYYKVTGKFSEEKEFPINELEAMDKEIRLMYEPINKCIQQVSNPTIAYILYELIILGRWKDIMQSVGGDYDSFTKQWDEGRYPLKKTHFKAYMFHKERFMKWMDTGLNNLSHRVIQKMIRYCISLAEAGEDISLIDFLTKKSLDLTEGIVTEATPQEVPGILAAYLDLQGKKSDALKYYEMSLEALKTAVPPLYSDAILYRAVSIMDEEPDKYSKKEILKTIGKLHPAD